MYGCWELLIRIRNIQSHRWALSWELTLETKINQPAIQTAIKEPQDWGRGVSWADLPLWVLFKLATKSCRSIVLDSDMTLWLDSPGVFFIHLVLFLFSPPPYCWGSLPSGFHLFWWLFMPSERRGVGTGYCSIAMMLPPCRHPYLVSRTPSQAPACDRYHVPTVWWASCQSPVFSALFSLLLEMIFIAHGRTC